MDEKWKKGLKKQMVERYKEEEKRKIQFYRDSELALPNGGKIRIPPKNLWVLIGHGLNRQKYKIPYPFAIRTGAPPKTATPKIAKPKIPKIATPKLATPNVKQLSPIKCSETEYRVFHKKKGVYGCRRKPTRKPKSAMRAPAMRAPAMRAPAMRAPSQPLGEFGEFGGIIEELD